MTARDADAPRDGRRPIRVARRAGVALAVVIVVVPAVVWLERKPIAASYIDRYFADRHVPVRYRIVDLGLRRQRLVDVVIGDPARPDLVADWIELSTRLDLSGAQVTMVRVGAVRLRARLIGQRLSFGALDRLLPASSGGPFALPGIAVDIADLRARLEAPQGVVAVRLHGKGRLDDGFSGQVAAVSPRLAEGGCAADDLRLVSAVRIVRARPTLTGWARAAGAACGDAAVSRAAVDFDTTGSATLDRWTGKATLAADGLRHPQGVVTGLAGTVGFDAQASGVAGTADLSARRVASPSVGTAAVAVAGRYRAGRDGLGFDGTAKALGATLPQGFAGRIANAGGAADGTPVAPLARRFAGALGTAARRFDLDAALAIDTAHGVPSLAIDRVALTAASGARARFDGHALLRYDRTVAAQVGGTVTTAGGGLPELRATVAQAAAGAPVTGTAIVQPYAADGARLALTPVAFSVSATGGRVATRVSLSGPVGNGSVSDLALPLTALWNGRSGVVINPDCAPLTMRGLAASGVRLNPVRTQLCPLAGALVRWDGARLSGGARIGAISLAGTLGQSPLTLAATNATLDLATRGFTLRGLGVRLGTAERQTRLDIASLDGSAAGGLGGSFSGGAGQIGAVPLLLSSAAGQWRFANGTVALDGALTVADSAATPRFTPLAARGVALSIAGNTVRATGTLVEPAKTVAVADVTIAHDLGSASGSADLVVPGITFGPAFQPDALTPLTFGVIADVAGTVSGEGHIRWDAKGVTSDGVFRTKGTNLAAAFGPVTGITTEIHFTDLLALESAPGQLATITTINPGVPVTDGTIRYQTLSGARVKVESARWPFAGGTLGLDPATLDFGQPTERTLTFRVGGVDAAQFLQQFGFTNLDATGTFDGTLPIVFDATGGRIEKGELSVRKGGGTLAYVGPISQKDLGFWGNFAFQSLKSLRYRDLGIAMNGPLAGEMVTEVRFAGVGQGAGAKRNFLLDRLQKLPLVFNVRITAPFRQLIDSAQSFYDPRRLIERNLPALIEEQKRIAAAPAPVQPAASRNVP